MNFRPARMLNVGRSRLKLWPPASVSIISLLSDVKILKIADGCNLFIQFLKEQTSENEVDFWLDCQKFRSSKMSSRQNEARRIFDEYFAMGSPKKVINFYNHYFILQLICSDLHREIPLVRSSSLSCQ